MTKDEAKALLAARFDYIAAKSLRQSADTLRSLGVTGWDLHVAMEDQRADMATAKAEALSEVERAFTEAGEQVPA